MAIPTFYHPSLSRSDTRLTLSQSEAAHAVKSRRLKAGQTVRLLNGQGAIGLGDITGVGRNSVTVELTQFSQVDSPARRLSIATAIPKGDRQKVMLDILTQLGCAKIIPVLYEHSVTKFSDNLAQKWRRTVLESCKQSQNPWVPEICDFSKIEDVIKAQSQTTVYADASGKGLAENDQGASALTVLIGPEGGFSANELALFTANGLRPLRLGPHVLRTEAAAVAAAAHWAQRGHA